MLAGGVQGAAAVRGDPKPVQRGCAEPHQAHQPQGRLPAPPHARYAPQNASSKHSNSPVLIKIFFLILSFGH